MKTTIAILGIFLVATFFSCGCIDNPADVAPWMEEQKYTFIVTYELLVNPSLYGIDAESLLDNRQQFDFLTEREVRELIEQVREMNEEEKYGKYIYEIREM